tara:strand:+ start:8722 stop:8967 length:246 start_codon:yes stop_codon:yes gene_type:complete
MSEKEELITITSAMVCMSFPEEVDGIYQLTMMMKRKLLKQMEVIEVDYDENEITSILFECLPKIMELYEVGKSKGMPPNCS